MAELHLLVPLDGSGFARTVLGAVRALFTPATAHLTLLRVGESPRHVAPVAERPTSPSGAMLPDYEAVPEDETHVWASQEWESARQRLRDDVAPDARRLERDGWDVEIATAFGDPAEEIVRWCADHEPDLVAMATHGRSGLSRALLGSVAERSLRRLSVPILMLRPEEAVDAVPNTAVEAAAEPG